MNARRGLKRIGMWEYLIAGPAGTYIIERDRPRRYIVRASHLPREFTHGIYNRLWLARVTAEFFAGVADIPAFLDRRPQ